MRDLLAWLAMALTFPSMAQQAITGRVLDAATKEPLAFVPFVIEGTRTGTTSDIDGRFTLHVPQLPVTLKASYVGYEPLLITVSDARPLSVLLTASNTELQPVVIGHTENPAHRIIRRAYANRKENDGLRRHSYRYTSYSKTVFDLEADSTARKDASAAEPDTTVQAAADTGRVDSAEAEFRKFLETQHLFLIESATKKSFIPPAAEKEEVLAMRVSGLKDPGFMTLVAQTKTFSIYAPQIDIGDKSYLGPIGPASTSKYLFVLEDTLYQGRDSVYVISYRPRRSTKFDGLEGLLYINTDGYAVQNVTAEPVQRSGMSIRFQQQHRLLPTATGDSAWFPVQLNSFIYLNSVSINGLSVYGEGKTYLKHIELDPDIPRKEVRGPELVVAKQGLQRDDAYWAGLREDTLGAKDLRTYEMMDSLGQAEHFDRKLKFLAALTTGRLPVGPVDLRLDQVMAYNDYEGFRLGAGLVTNDKVSRHASLGGYFAYGFGDKHWKYGGDLTIKPLYGRDLHLKLAYANDVAEIGGVAFEGRHGPLLSQESYRMLYVDRMDRIERFSAQVMLRAGSSLKLWLGTERALRVNDIGHAYVEPVSDGVTLQRSDFLTGAYTLDLRWAFREQLARLPGQELSLGTKFPIVYVHAMKARKGLWEGEWDTWRVDAMVEKTFKVRLLGDLSLRLMGGVADTDAPMAFLYNLRGTLSRRFPVAGTNVFETMRPNEFLADRYAAFHLKHSFGKLLIDTKHFKPRPAIVTSVAFGGLSRPENHQGLAFNALGNGYYESGLLIENLLRSGFSSLGVGGFYRYGPYALPDQGDNFAVKVTAGYAF
ncbi:MAG: carboxypeptidase-like regulatory domain-containing protein [Flavobacteriales bacterium]|nr:carboxypeptidase-like regulatory domain-containing protein [Flavobacteriales bacterium]